MLFDVGILISLSLTPRCILKQAYLFSEKLLGDIFKFFFVLPPLISISVVSSLFGKLWDWLVPVGSQLKWEGGMFTVWLACIRPITLSAFTACSYYDQLASQ